MKTVEIIGYKRANLGKAESKRLRNEGYVPCVIYGGNEQIHFYAPMILFKELVYTPEAHFVNLNIEGIEKRAILQDIQFHPVSEIILHADFLELFEGKDVTMNIPVKPHGVAPGVQKGGRLMHKTKYLSIKALPKNMPDAIHIDVSKLDMGDTIKVSEIEEKDFSILNSSRVTIASVNVPRSARNVEEEEMEGEEMEAEGAEEGEGENTED